nr:hypothetical protein [Pandoravirus massiliensis]
MQRQQGTGSAQRTQGGRLAGQSDFPPKSCFRCLANTGMASGWSTNRGEKEEDENRLSTLKGCKERAQAISAAKQKRGGNTLAGWNFGKKREKGGRKWDRRAGLGNGRDGGMHTGPRRARHHRGE